MMAEISETNLTALVGVVKNILGFETDEWNKLIRREIESNPDRTMTQISKAVKRRIKCL